MFRHPTTSTEGYRSTRSYPLASTSCSPLSQSSSPPLLPIHIRWCGLDYKMPIVLTQVPPTVLNKLSEMRGLEACTKVSLRTWSTSCQTSALYSSSTRRLPMAEKEYLPTSYLKAH